MDEVSHAHLGPDESRAEVDALLASTAFSRSPRAARLFHYLCSKYLAGEAAEIKEYNIAVDVLGRPETFDPAQDAGVRVEIHRLRKKLREYYEGEGATHTLRVAIPTGCYVPVFSRTEPTEPAEVPRQLMSVPPMPALKSAPAGPWSTRGVAGLLAVGAVLIVVGSWLHFRPSIKAESKAGLLPESADRAATQAAPVGPPPGTTIRMLAGRTQGFTDQSGVEWAADNYFSGGEPFHRAVAQLGRTRNPSIYGAGREGDFSYDIPTSPGTYELRLHFAETEYGPGLPKGGGENNRVFHVILNSQRILSDFDIVADAEGSGIADGRVFKDVRPGADGQIHLTFVSVRDKALVNAIEVTPSRPGRLNPIRIRAGERPLDDPRGEVWIPDDMVSGGQVRRASAVRNAVAPGLFETERYGHFTYAVPVANGTYEVTLHLAETFWGPESAGGGGPGSRVFNILCNGVAIARNLDVYKEVGGNRALVLRYPGIKPNPQGKLVFDFEPVRNYASVYGVEILDSTP